MNTTLWNNHSTPEAIVHAMFGLGSMILHFYAIFLCCAIIDYQDEKPQNEKSSFDVLTKDFLRSKLCLLYFWTYVQLISLFTPPHITGLQNFFYLLTYLGVFLGNFDNCVTLVTLYVKYVFTFQPDDVENLQIKKLRTKTFIWKILLSIIAILLNVMVQLSDDNQGTLVFKLLAKGQIFERYVILELVTMELNHLAAILHVYVGV